MPEATATESRAAPSGWIRGPRFDLTLILGVMVLALAAGSLAWFGPPGMFAWVLLADVWLLAYPHVASTYTRVALDRASARRYWRLLLLLPPVVLAATAGTACLGGALVLNTVYFFWQSWHYTRQSYGLERAYSRLAYGRPDRLAELVIYAFPLWGLLHRAHQQPDGFYNLPIWVPPVPLAVELAAAAVAIVAFVAWLHRLSRERSGRATGHTLFVLSHVVITVVGYILIDEITYGWLFVNIWHNAQYLLFVWARNAKRYRGGIDPAAKLISTLSQPRNVVAYGAVCLALGTSFYLALGWVSNALVTELLPVVLVTHLAVNFHHYLVDAVIWRRPRA